MISRLARIAAIADRRRLAVCSIWILAGLLAWTAASLDRATRFGGLYGNVMARMLEGDRTEYDGYRRGNLDALNLVSTLLTVAALRDAGTEYDWSYRHEAGYDGIILRHGDMVLPVANVSASMRGTSSRGMPDVSLDPSRVPLVPIVFPDGSSSAFPSKGRIRIGLETRSPRTCREVVKVISMQPAVVANFEVADPAAKAAGFGGAWQPLDPSKSDALKRICRSQFEGGDFAGRYLGGGQSLDFRLSSPDRRPAVPTDGKRPAM